MADNRIIAPIPEDFEFNSGGTTPISTGAPVGDDVQYLDRVPEVYTNTATTAVSGGNVPSAPGSLASPNADLLGNLTLMDLIQMLVVYAFIAAAALSAVFIFVGGISFILSGGNDEKIKQAINTIRYSIIGLIVTILSFTFVAIVGRMFGLNFMDFLSYDKIKNDINRLVQPFSAQNQTNFEVRN